MTRPPHRPDNYEHEQDLVHREEAFRLQQEEQRLDLAQRNSALRWVTNSIFLLVGLLEILLALRFFLRLTAANPNNLFASSIYSLSRPFVAPFSTLFISPTAAGGANIFDVNALVAILAYAILGCLAVWLIDFIRGR